MSGTQGAGFDAVHRVGRRRNDFRISAVLIHVVRGCRCWSICDCRRFPGLQARAPLGASAFSMKGKTVKAISVFAGISGVLLLCAFGYAYAEYLAVAQWGSWQSYPLFILEGLAVGVSLIGVCAPQSYSNARLAVCAVVLLALSAVATVAEGAHFAACGALSAPFFVGAVLQVAAGAIVVAKRSQPATWVAPCVFALAFAGVAVARYAFYCM